MRDGSIDRADGELDRYHGSGKPPVAVPEEASPPRLLTGPRRQKPEGKAGRGRKSQAAVARRRGAEAARQTESVGNGAATP